MQRTNVLHTLAQHHLVEDLATLHADERVVHLRLVARGHLRCRVIAIEGRGGNRSLGLLGGGSALGALDGVLHDGLLSALLDGGIAVGRDGGRRGRRRETAGGAVEALESATRLACFEHCDEWRALRRRSRKRSGEVPMARSQAGSTRRAQRVSYGRKECVVVSQE